MAIFDEAPFSQDDALLTLNDAIARLTQKARQDLDAPNWMVWLAQGFLILRNILGITGNLGIGINRAAEIEGWLLNPTNIPPAGEMIIANRRGVLADALLADVLNANGFDDRWFGVLRSVAVQLLSTTELTEAVNRGIIDQDTFTRKLDESGIEPDDRAVIDQLRKVIPPLGDIITMAVREAFDPEAVARGGLLQNIKDEFIEAAAAKGLTRDWAEKYWIAHWRLPEPRQGFQMMHRGVIDQEELRQLLVALDVAPGWIDRMTAISFNPFTRVDIRRMFNIGELTRDEVVRAYKDIGYDDEKAEKLTLFAESLKDAQDPEIAAEIRGLTRSAVTKLQETGTIGEAEALDLYMELGIGEQAAQTFVDLTELKMAEREREAEIDFIKAEVNSGALPVDRARDQLNGLGLEDREVSLIVNELKRRQIRGDKMPTLDTIKSLFREELLTSDELRDALFALGFGQFWVDKIEASIGVVKNGKR